MFKCTYIILIHNNEKNIPALIDSLKNLEGRFKKEFIIIDDGSKDNSLKILKKAIVDLPKTILITQEHEGPAASINRAIKLATGIYTHFVEGDEILHPKATLILITACVNHLALVGCAKVSYKSFFDPFVDLEETLLKEPFKEILLHKNSHARNIGGSGTLINTKFINAFGGIDSGFYSQKMALSLKSASFDSFVMVNNVVTRKIVPTEPIDRKFEAYNTLNAIYDFANKNPGAANKLIPELLKALALEMQSVISKIVYYLEFIKAKYLKSTNLEQVLEFYRAELEKLF